MKNKPLKKGELKKAPIKKQKYTPKKGKK